MEGEKDDARLQLERKDALTLVLNIFFRDYTYYFHSSELAPTTRGPGPTISYPAFHTQKPSAPRLHPGNDLAPIVNPQINQVRNPGSRGPISTFVGHFWKLDGISVWRALILGLGTGIQALEGSYGHVWKREMRVVVCQDGGTVCRFQLPRTNNTM